MMKRLLAAAVLVAGMIGVVGAQEKKPPTIDEVMKKVNNPRMGLKTAVDSALKANTIDWEDVQKKSKEMVEHLEALGKNTPPRGAKESWEKLTKEFLDSAKKVEEAAKKKDKDATTKALTALGQACRTCHTAHKAKS